MSENWERLGRYVRTHRQQAGLSTTRALADATGISERTIGQLERGNSVSRNTIAAVEVALGWAPGSALRVLAGDEPQSNANGNGPERRVDHGALAAMLLARWQDEGFAAFREQRARYADAFDEATMAEIDRQFEALAVQDDEQRQRHA